jgi:cysteinyl-tRNA synthetase
VPGVVAAMPVTLYNTMSRRKEEFIPLDPPTAKIYCCGPTVYNYSHIGNLRTYIFEDILRRTLLFNGFGIEHVMNITDVGHMTSDADDGDDKMQSAAQRENKSPWEIARFYEDAFFKDTDRLNIQRPEVTPRATDHVVEMIEIIQRLEANGYIYVTSEGVYFDTSRDDDY